MQSAEITAPPQITGQPQNQVVGPGETAAFSVVATGSLPLTFQWRFNNANIGGANGDALLLESVGVNNPGEYRVVVTNPSGSVTSAPAFLLLDSDHDGMGDSWELTYFGILGQNATSDFDGDGNSNFQEFLDDTDPTDSASARFRLLVISEAGPVIKTPDQSSYTNGETVTLTAIPPPNGVFHAWLGDIVTRSNPVSFAMTKDMTVYPRFTPIIFTWTNLASGDWDVATNWSPRLAPGSNDTVVITSGVTVTLNTPADCADFTLGSGVNAPTLTGSGTLMVRGNFLWPAGTMSGSGRTVVAAGATLTIANPNGLALTTRTLENAGTVLWTSTGNTITLSGGCVITNRPGALFEVQNASTFAFNGSSPRFDNAGTFRKSANAGTLTVGNGVSFNNSGTVEIQAGTLRLAGGSATGTFDTPATTLLEWNGGSFTLNAGAQLNGAGLYKINNTVTANTNLTVPNLDLIAGILNGPGAVTISNVMNWTGGTMGGSGRTIIAPGGTLNLSNATTASLSGGRTLENGGTVIKTGAGSIGLDTGAVITNRAGALFDLQSAVSFVSVFAPNRIDNVGTFRKSANAGTTSIPLIFNNSGTVEILTGTLSLSGGGTNSGSFSVPAGAMLNLAGDTYAAGGSSSITGAGHFTVSGATANLAGLVNVSGSNTFSSGTANLTGNCICTNNTVTISGGTANFSGTGLVSPAVVNLSLGSLDGTSTVTVNSVMNWTGGAMNGTGRTIIPPGVTLNAAITVGATLATRTLENGGTILWTGAGAITMNTAVITNRAGALFHVQNASQFQPFGVNRFDNAGTFRKSTSTGPTTLPNMGFNNYGTVDIRSGILAVSGSGSYNSTSNALLNCALGGTTAGTNYGQLQVAGAVTLNGALSVNLLPGFTPATNDTFTVITAGTRSGTNTSFTYPANRVTMQLSNTPNAVVLRVTDVFPVPQPILLTPQLVGSNALLTWTATSNFTYRLENNADADPTNWTALPGDVTTLSNTASKLDALTPSNRLYRVRVLP